MRGKFPDAVAGHQHRCWHRLAKSQPVREAGCTQQGLRECIVEARFVSGRREHVASKQCAGSLRSEEHTSELQSQSNLVCRLLLEKKKNRHAKKRQEETNS